MRTPETDAKAETVRHFLVGKNVVVLEHHYADKSQSRDDPRDYVRLKQREWYYRYMIQDKTGATEIRVTLDAMRDVEVDPLGHLVLAARQRKAHGEVGTAWVELVEGQPMVALEK
jgi:hypothetical protein